MATKPQTIDEYLAGPRKSALRSGRDDTYDYLSGMGVAEV